MDNKGRIREICAQKQSTKVGRLRLDRQQPGLMLSSSIETTEYYPSFGLSNARDMGLVTLNGHTRGHDTT
jgi:hypothetical protein